MTDTEEFKKQVDVEFKKQLDIAVKGVVRELEAEFQKKLNSTMTDVMQELNQCHVYIRELEKRMVHFDPSFRPQSPPSSSSSSSSSFRSFTPQRRHVLPICGVCEQGERKTQEDRLVLERLHDIAVAGVFDGHNGDECVNRLTHTEHGLVPNMIKAIHTLDMDAWDATVLTTIFNRLFIEYDMRALAGVESGSTAALALVPPTNDRIVFLNVGDSASLLVNVTHGTAEFKTTDHNARNESEAKRVKEAGGTVMESKDSPPRLQGFLEVTRAFGDHVPTETFVKHGIPRALKTRTTTTTVEEADHDILIARPDVDVVALSPACDYVLVSGSDGFWNCFRNDVVVNHITSEYKKHRFADGENKTTLCHQMRDFATSSQGSHDNVTVSFMALFRESSA